MDYHIQQLKIEVWMCIIYASFVKILKQLGMFSGNVFLWGLLGSFAPGLSTALIIHFLTCILFCSILKRNWPLMRRNWCWLFWRQWSGIYIIFLPRYLSVCHDGIFKRDVEIRLKNKESLTRFTPIRSRTLLWDWLSKLLLTWFLIFWMWIFPQL